jgi:hypothetical protein
MINIRLEKRLLRSLSYRATSADETFLRFQRRNDNFPPFQGWQPL